MSFKNRLIRYAGNFGGSGTEPPSKSVSDLVELIGPQLKGFEVQQGYILR